MTALRALPTVLGTALVAYGVHGLLGALGPPALVRWFVFFLAGTLATDLVLMPFVDLLLRRVRPGRRLIAGGVVISGVLTLVATPFLTGGGRDPSVPSALPLDYGRGLLVLLAAVWLGVAILAVVSARRR
ncbi:hypothetical protein [Cryptosporangium sp. NPDC048952]|uniref:hypothetical protein n=1 Tax=Cryptosporangium sp. NPDC048952 TaxID=3363961 RepID=UPI003717CAC1